MKKTLSLFLLLSALGVHAQQATISNISGGAQKGHDLNFPVVSLPDKAIARKINDYLQVHVLDQTTLKAPGVQVFNKVKYTSSRPGIDILEYKVHANNGKLLSLGLDGDWMSAHPNNYETHFVFNSQNGEIIFPEDIFTAQGLKSLAAELKAKRSGMIAGWLKKLKTAPDGEENLEHIKEELTTCNGDAGLQAFYVTDSSIVFYKGNCLEYAIQSLDTNFDVAYSFSQARPFLSAFGQKLFSPGTQDISRDSFPSLAKPLRGKIDNKYDIVMQLSFRSDNSVGGFYYYNNYQSAIEISGKLEGGVLELKEHDADFNDTAVFTGATRGTAYSGIWTNLKTKKSLKFEVRN